MSNPRFKTGDRVQFWSDTPEDRNIYPGTVLEVILPLKPLVKDWWQLPEEEQLDMQTTTVVRWDDGSPDERLDIGWLEPEDSPLDKEFRSVADKALDEIYEKLGAASKALSEAVALSEQYGVPFHANISFLSQGYLPVSYKTKFKDVSKYVMTSVTECHNEYEGWKHSAVCY
jgi:hypothetical protein